MNCLYTALSSNNPMDESKSLKPLIFANERVTEKRFSALPP